MEILEKEDAVPTPTPQQDDLFQSIISNFINMAPSHRQVLVQSRFGMNLADIDKWQKKEDLPDLSRRSRIMDFIWIHYCDCKCY